eukprot:11175522-Lingulodinium_polyedra.AAC.1
MVAAERRTKTPSWRGDVRRTPSRSPWSGEIRALKRPTPPPSSKTQSQRHSETNRMLGAWP